MITNPILPGFNPDPSFLRVGSDYYIATSTFEWFPGVQIHHSKDLVHWHVITHPLNRIEQLDLRGNPSSGGIWAPNLTYKDGIFYLLYTDVKNRTGVYKDVHNYLVTAENIMGPWSDPIYLNSSGFDPAFFHDDDGKSWLLNMNWNFRKNHHAFDGILLQEYCHVERQLIGDVKKIFDGESWVIEGSNMYKHDGYYYIMLAEGGTGYLHSATMVRSKNIEGPYERDPNSPLLTSVDQPDHPMQKAGHGSIIEAENGKWYLAHLYSRPLKGRKLCPLGRETGLQEIEWTESGWLRLTAGGHTPFETVADPGLAKHPFPALPIKDDFDEQKLGIQYHTLRVPFDESWVSLSQRPGYLRIRGRESLTSLHHQSMVARRIEHFDCDIETCIEFEPNHFNEMAGLICWYDEMDYYYLRMSHDEKIGKHLRIMLSDFGEYDELVENSVSLEGIERVYLKAEIRYDELQFLYSINGTDFQKIGPKLDFGTLSDEYKDKLGFTGAMVGICAQDLTSQSTYADFDYFIYREVKQ